MMLNDTDSVYAEISGALEKVFGIEQIVVGISSVAVKIHEI